MLHFSKDEPETKCDQQITQENRKLQETTKTNTGKRATEIMSYVTQFLGHKNIKNTLIYIRLAEVISKTADEYICKAVSTVDEAKTLNETGFEFITDMDNYKLFRKRK